MDKQEAREYGYDNGCEIGCENHPDFTDFDEYMAACSEYESDEFRQYSPFESFAHDVNKLGEWDAEECWEAYDMGVMEGLRDAWEGLKTHGKERNNMADIREWMQACQNTLDAAVELATMLDEGITDTKLWPIEAREYAAMLLEDAITQWEDN